MDRKKTLPSFKVKNSNNFLPVHIVLISIRFVVFVLLTSPLSRIIQLLKYKADLIWRHAGTAPVIQIIVQISIANSKLQRFQKGLVLHQVESVEYIETGILGSYKGVVD